MVSGNSSEARIEIMSDQKQKVLDFIKEKMMAVVATVNKEGKPEAVLVAFTETDDLELIFGTANTARKYINLKNDPNVAMVIGHDQDERITVQIEGVAREAEGDEVKQCRDVHVKKHPTAEKYAAMPEQRWFNVTPTWIRYTDTNSEAPEEFEIDL